MENALFQWGPFTSHSGPPLSWKICTEALSVSDWQTIAKRVAQTLPFGRVLGIPRGGIVFAECLKPYATAGLPGILVVDDVLTTGTSMRQALAELDGAGTGVVLFARGPIPDDLPVVAVFHLGGIFQ